ncbi:hypothetical protein [Rhodoblastus sp.]|uniref:hypothetical protein n=1 Tax=Rhodoblastus sp. TaxID=1962975 RepID=UPI0035B2F21F
MARALTAFLKREAVPARKALQGALDPLGFKVVLDDDYIPLKSKGYIPCALDGEDAGFDLRFQEVEAEARAKYGLAEDAVGMAIRWGGDPREELAALAVLVALALDFGALVAEPGAAAPLAAEDLLAKARKAAQSV